MDTKEIISIILAVISFAIIFIVGVSKNDLLRSGPRLKPEDPETPYSFHKTQFWLWTLVIAPCFSLNWGFVAKTLPTLNETALVLLGISGGTALVAEVINASHKNNLKEKETLKSVNVPTTGFWSDILKDDHGQFSVLRLQQLIFTITYIGIYLTMFFPDKKWPEFGDNAYLLMGISTGSFLVGKGLHK